MAIVCNGYAEPMDGRDARFWPNGWPGEAVPMLIDEFRYRPPDWEDVSSIRSGPRMIQGRPARVEIRACTPFFDAATLRRLAGGVVLVAIGEEAFEAVVRGFRRGVHGGDCELTLSSGGETFRAPDRIEAPTLDWRPTEMISEDFHA